MDLIANSKPFFYEQMQPLTVYIDQNLNFTTAPVSYDVVELKITANDQKLWEFTNVTMNNTTKTAFFQLKPRIRDHVGTYIVTLKLIDDDPPVSKSTSQSFTIEVKN